MTFFSFDIPENRYVGRVGKDVPSSNTKSVTFVQFSNAEVPMDVTFAGMDTSVRPLHPENALAPMDVTVEIPGNSVIAVPLNADAPIDVIPSGRTGAVRDVQPSNSESGICVTPDGIFTFFRAVSPLNSPLGRDVIVFPCAKVTVSRAVHPVRAVPFISVTVAGMLRVSRLSHPAKAFFPIFVRAGFLGIVTFFREDRPLKAPLSTEVVPL